MIVDHLNSGHNVIVGQFLARTEFIEQMDALAAERRATFVELVHAVAEDTLCSRLARAADPERVEHVVNAALVSTQDVPALARAIGLLISVRPSSLVIDANDSHATTLDLIRTWVSGGR